MAGEFACDGEESVAEAFGVPEPGAVAGRDRGELEPGEQVGGQSCDVGPGLVRAGGDDFVTAGATKLVLESDKSLEPADRKIVAQHLKSHDGEGLQYMQCKPHEEPLLWVTS